MKRFLDTLDCIVRGAISAAQWLVVPLLLLLFLQWPLRDLVHAYSREANDIAQWIFALYVAIAVTAATRAGTHLAADAWARRYTEKTRLRLVRAGALLGLLPWAIFIWIASRKIVVSSAMQLELFPDSYNPGYFLVKCALWVLSLLVIAQAILDIARPKIPGGGHP